MSWEEAPNGIYIKIRQATSEGELFKEADDSFWTRDQIRWQQLDQNIFVSDKRKFLHFILTEYDYHNNPNYLASQKHAYIILTPFNPTFI